jgi:hypothetical protein
MLRKIMLVVLMFSFFALPVSAQNVATQLNFSHACDLGTGELEMHFVLVQSPNVDYTGTFVSWSASFDGGPAVTGVSPYDNRTGGTVHYRANVPPAFVVTVYSATLVVGGTTYQLSNPGTVTVDLCVPTAIVIDAFTVACIPGGVRLEWTVTSELGILRYTVLKDGSPILVVPSDCPGCTTPRSYTREVLTTTPNGTYALDAGIDTATAALTGCGAPTAVRLAKFSAR